MSKTAYIFPGQGSQFPGMGKTLYERDKVAQEMFEEANEIMGFRISDLMFSGTEEDLKQTIVTQPAIFIYSAICYNALITELPAAAAGHSLGEFTALFAANCLTFSEALHLVKIRAEAMQYACEVNPGTMAAVIGLEEIIVEKTCQSIENEVVVPANYNCPGQLVISGTEEGISLACEKLKEVGAKRVIRIPVGGAFHSPLMKPAQINLSEAIDRITLKAPNFPIHQNVVAWGVMHPDSIKQNLKEQLTNPVRWTQTVQSMHDMGIENFVEIGPGKVLQGLVQKIRKGANVTGLNV